MPERGGRGARAHRGSNGHLLGVVPRNHLQGGARSPADPERREPSKNAPRTRRRAAELQRQRDLRAAQALEQWAHVAVAGLSNPSPSTHRAQIGAEAVAALRAIHGPASAVVMDVISRTARGLRASIKECGRTPEDWFANPANAENVAVGVLQSLRYADVVGFEITTVTVAAVASAVRALCLNRGGRGKKAAAEASFDTAMTALLTEMGIYGSAGAAWKARARQTGRKTSR
jgi:hypothetical protein